MSTQILVFSFVVLLIIFKQPRGIKAYWDDDFFKNDVTLIKPQNNEDAVIDIGEHQRRRAKREVTEIPKDCKPKPLDLKKRVTQSEPLSPKDLEKAQKKQ